MNETAPALEAPQSLLRAVVEAHMVGGGEQWGRKEYKGEPYLSAGQGSFLEEVAFI